jgi:hypothetical protein
MKILCTGDTMTGLQIGSANYAGHLSGLQAGLVNKRF